MGMYPGATLSYGIAVPDDIYWDELPWYSSGRDGEYIDGEEEGLKLLEEAGLDGVTFVSFGHMGYGETGTILATKSMRFYAYDVYDMQASELEVPPGDAELLERAWDLLFDDAPYKRPSWVLALTYG